MQSIPIHQKIEKKIGTATLLFFAIFFVFIIPILNLFTSPESIFHISDFTLNLFGKFLSYAILALGIDLIWGFTGTWSWTLMCMVLCRRILIFKFNQAVSAKVWGNSQSIIFIANCYASSFSWVNSYAFFKRGFHLFPLFSYYLYD
mgnify:CR=1 FL=1